MIRSLHGTIQALLLDAVILDVHGVGYEVLCTKRAFQGKSVGEELSLSIYTHVKEDALQLFGFLAEEERALFLLLLSVSGVGPRTALQVLHAGGSSVVQAIRSSDVAYFQSSPRLGKKTAQKIIVELQSKVGDSSDISFLLPNSVSRDVEEALQQMGYSGSALQPVLQKIQPDWTLEYALKWAIQQLRQNRGGAV
jgi:Holliday junction DNA helicase RuvA